MRKLTIITFLILCLVSVVHAATDLNYTYVPVPPVRYFWEYDDFSSGNLDLTKWIEKQDPEGQPFMVQHYVDRQEGRYHTQSVGSNDQRVVLHLTGYQFIVGDVLEYDVYYNSGSGGIFVYLNGGPVNRMPANKCPTNIEGNLLGRHHIKLSFDPTNITFELIDPNNFVSKCQIPINQRWQYGGKTWSSSPPWMVGVESYSSGLIHADYDNFIISGF